MEEQPAAFAAVITDILAALDTSNRLNPVPEEGARMTWPLHRLGLQVIGVLYQLSRILAAPVLPVGQASLPRNPVVATVSLSGR